MGVASVGLLVAAVRRWFGPVAGLIAGIKGMKTVAFVDDRATGVSALIADLAGPRPVEPVLTAALDEIARVQLND